MSSPLDKSRFLLGTDEKWARIAPLLKKGAILQESDYNAAGWDLDLPLGLMISELADLHFRVFHGCSTEPVALRGWYQGFQPTPWQCPGCRKEVLRDELMYDVQATVLDDIELV